MSQSAFYIYVIQNLVNDRVYIGRTTVPKSRFRQHRYDLRMQKHGNDHLQKAWNKYGAESFAFFVLGEYADSAEMHAAESFYVNWYRLIGLSYNIKDGGHGEATHSPETREKIRLSWQNRKPMTEEVKAKIRQTLLGNIPWNKGKSIPGHPHTEESKEKIRQAKLGVPLSDDRKAQLSRALSGEKSPWFGRKHTEETKRKIGEKNRINSLGNTSRLGTGRKKPPG